MVGRTCFVDGFHKVHVTAEGVQGLLGRSTIRMHTFTLGSNEKQAQVSLDTLYFKRPFNRQCLKITEKNDFSGDLFSGCLITFLQSDNDKLHTVSSDEKNDFSGDYLFYHIFTIRL